MEWSRRRGEGSALSSSDDLIISLVTSLVTSLVIPVSVVFPTTAVVTGEGDIVDDGVLSFVVILPADRAGAFPAGLGDSFTVDLAPSAVFVPLSAGIILSEVGEAVEAGETEEILTEGEGGVCLDSREALVTTGLPTGRLALITTGMESSVEG